MDQNPPKSAEIPERQVSPDVIRELVQTVRSNQQMAEEVIKLNTDMVRRVSELTISIGELTKRINEMISKFQLSPEKDQTALAARLEKLEKRVNAMIISSLTRRRMSMPSAMPMA